MKIRNLLMLVVLIGWASSSHAQFFGGLKKVQNAPLHAGTSRTYEHGSKEVLKASREAMVEAGLSMEGSSKVDADNFMLLGSRRANVTGWGEVARILITKEGENQTTVRVYTLKRVKVNVTAKGDFASSILSNIDLKLNDDF